MGCGTVFVYNLDIGSNNYLSILTVKGIVFTELLNMVEQQYGYELVDDLLCTTELPSGGNYTAVGTYPAQEMVSLVVGLSQHTDVPVPDLLRHFGRYLFQGFLKSYRHLIVAAPESFTFLESVHNYIHVEVKKLYPDAELPSFDVERLDEKTLQMTYMSSRRMADLAYGLIEGAMMHYGDKATITKQALSEDGSKVQFVIVKE